MNARLAASLVLALVLAAGASPTLAQEGGGGRILEADLRKGGGGNTPRASMYREVQMRNALVTGNVGGLSSFRGNVGYRAPNEFRGGLGSDNSFSFRRTAASPITGRSVRGGDALRYQMGNTTGSGYRPQTLISASGPTGRAAAQAPIGSDGIGNASSFSSRQGFSPLNSSLRSTATFTSTQSLQPSVINRTDARGTRTTVGSSLLGVRDLPGANNNTGFGTSGFANPGGTRALPAPTRTGEPELRPGQVQSTVQPITQQAIRSAAEPLVTNLAKNTNMSRSVLDELRDRQRTLAASRVGSQREAATDTGAANATGNANASDPNNPAPQGDAWEQRLADLRQRLLPKDQQLTQGGLSKTRDALRSGLSDRRGELAKEMNEDTLSVIREGAGQTRRFVAEAVDAYSEHMTKGQELMGQGRYFDAEERFTKALSAREGDATAMAGRLHAQLGAGLYLSAGINLRDLFSKNPDIIAMRYVGDTIPASDRLITIAADLRARIARTKDVGGVMSIDEGLLMAYIAWQMGDAALTNEGLLAAEAADKQRQSVGDDADPLVVLLRKVWLPSTVKQAAPAEGTP